MNDGWIALEACDRANTNMFSKIESSSNHIEFLELDNEMLCKRCH